MIPANNVGIGTSNPQSHLHVYNATTSPIFLLDGGGFGNRGTIRMVPTNAGNMIQSGSQLSNDSRADIVFSSMFGTTEFVRVRGATGNVGIGTTNPQARLDVNGSASFTTTSTNSITTSNISAISAAVSNIDVGCDITTRVVNIACSPCNQTVNIGNNSTGQTTINIGGPSDIIRISGSLNSVQTTNLEVTDKLIVLNKNGVDVSGVGFEIESNNSIVGYIKTDPIGNAFLIKTPNPTSEFRWDLSSDAVNMNNGTFVLANGGNIGVGTPTPLSKFNVSNGDITISHSLTAACALRLLPVGDTTKSFVVRGINDNMEIESVAGSNGRMRFLVGSNPNPPQEILSLTHTGRIGVNTSNPQTILDVNGPTRVNNTLICFNSNNTADGGHIVIGYANRNIFSESNGSWNIDTFNSNLRMFSLTSTAQSNFSTIFSENGNVGIVSTSTQLPQTKLDVYGTTTLRGGTSTLAPNNNQMIFAPSNADNNKHLIRTRHSTADDTNNAIDFYTWQQSQTTTAVGNKLIMSITNQGVGISTSNPAYQLDVLGSLRTTSLQYMNRASVYVGHWRLNSNIVHNNGASLIVVRNAWSNSTTTSFNEASLLDTDGRLNAPVAGIYTASIAMRFPVENAQSQCWFEHPNTSDRLGWIVSSTQIYNGTWTGFLDAGWKLTPVMWQSISSNVQYSFPNEISRPQLHFALIQPLI